MINNISGNVITNNIKILYDSRNITYQYSRRLNKSEFENDTIGEDLFYDMKDYLNLEESKRILERISSAETTKQVNRISIPLQFAEDEETELIDTINKAKEDKLKAL